MPEKITIKTLPAFNPPGFPYQDDQLNASQKAKWSDTIAGWMTEEINAGHTDKNGKFHPLKGGGGITRTPLTQFFNGRVTPFNVDQKPAAINWIGFPNLIKNDSDSDRERWETADASRDRQDEYLEWTVRKDKSGRIISVTFTCEGPEYWAFLAKNAPDKILALYKQHNPEYADQMKLQDLLENNKYNPFNKWNGIELKVPGDPDEGFNLVNPGSIMHLAQVNNTLSAEIDIAAQGTVLRKNADGTIIEDRVKLCNCSRYGQATRNSDPQIGHSINGLARNGNKVSIADPVAIYMNDFDSSNFKLDVDGSGENLQDVPKGTYTWERGDIDMNKGLRLHIQIPPGVMGTGDNAGRQLTVTDIVDSSNDQNVNYGAQFADYIQMVVNGVVISDGVVAEAQLCPKKQPVVNAMMMQSLIPEVVRDEEDDFAHIKPRYT